MRFLLKYLDESDKSICSGTLVILSMQVPLGLILKRTKTKTTSLVAFIVNIHINGIEKHRFFLRNYKNDFILNDKFSFNI